EIPHAGWAGLGGGVVALQLRVVADAVLVGVEGWTGGAVDEQGIHRWCARGRGGLEVGVDPADDFRGLRRGQANVRLHVRAEHVQGVKAALVRYMAGDALRHAERLSWELLLQ